MNAPAWKDAPDVAEGCWPAHCEQRSFVEGAKWWQFTASQCTAFASEVEAMESQAIERYGHPVHNKQTPAWKDAPDVAGRWIVEAYGLQQLITISGAVIKQPPGPRRYYGPIPEDER